MLVIRSVKKMQRLADAWRSESHRIALVPTMGFLHEGHLSLVDRARKIAGPSGKVVVSVYVNPTQFAPHEDLSKYPRDFKRDSSLCRQRGVDAIFAPSNHEMYPGTDTGQFSTYVVEEKLSREMEGRSRPHHFRGVTTVVAKLFNIVQPQTAIFGAKDFQQAAIIKRMVYDLNFPVKLIVAPTVREPSGLAMSSRNKYLDQPGRADALVLYRSLRLVAQAVRQKRGALSSEAARRLVLDFVSKSAPGARLDYVAFFNPATLEPVAIVKPGTRMALAVFIGKVRLIDNARL